MIIRVSEILNAGRIQRREKIDPASLTDVPAELENFRHPVELDVTAQKTAGEIYVKASVETQLTFTCSRCLESCQSPFSGEFTQTFSEELETINLLESIKETIFIDMPIKPLCKEECQGICATCGTNKNTTPCTCTQVSEESVKSGFKKLPL